MKHSAEFWKICSHNIKTPIIYKKDFQKFRKLTWLTGQHTRFIRLVLLGKFCHHFDSHFVPPTCFYFCFNFYSEFCWIIFTPLFLGFYNILWFYNLIWIDWHDGFWLIFSRNLPFSDTDRRSTFPLSRQRVPVLYQHQPRFTFTFQRRNLPFKHTYNTLRLSPFFICNKWRISVKV